MRDIKFRMWSKEYKTMYINEMLISASQGMIKAANYAMEHFDYEMNKVLPLGLYLPLTDEDAEFMQYTGLKDKNNKEIYEGDILKGINYDINRPKEFIGTVEYNWNRFIVNAKGFPLYDINTTLEVIGNIYENPELLKA